MRFALAPMCPLIRRLTLVMAALPVVLLIAGTLGPRALFLAAILALLIYGWVWARFQPTAFVVHPDTLEVIWPLKRRRMPL